MGPHWKGTDVSEPNPIDEDVPTFTTSDNLTRDKSTTGPSSRDKRPQDTELMDELARTCFKGSSFFKMDKRLPPLDSHDPGNVSRDANPRTRNDAQQNRETVAQYVTKQPMFSEADRLISQHNDSRQPRRHNPLSTFNTVDIRPASELIKIDESQFVTLSQVNRESSDGRSPYQGES